MLFLVTFAALNDNKINAIKVVREALSLGLKEAKDFVEAGLEGRLLCTAEDIVKIEKWVITSCANTREFQPLSNDGLIRAMRMPDGKRHLWISQVVELDRPTEVAAGPFFVGLSY